MIATASTPVAIPLQLSYDQINVVSVEESHITLSTTTKEILVSGLQALRLVIT